MKHEGKVAVVTGGSRGIGQAYARRLAQDGADIAVADMVPAEDTKRMVEEAGRRVMGGICDIASEEEVREFADGVRERFGRCDILVLNAGIYPSRGFEEMSFEEWRRVQSVNLDSMFLMCKAFVPGMKDRGWGRIVTMSSNACWLVAPGFTHYVASKMGVIGFTRALATEVADSGITVNAVAPSLVRTPTTEAGTQAGMFESLANMQAIKRVEVLEDLVGTVSFLASEDAAFMTGQTLLIDGGLVRT